MESPHLVLDPKGCLAAAVTTASPSGNTTAGALAITRREDLDMPSTLPMSSCRGIRQTSVDETWQSDEQSTSPLPLPLEVNLTEFDPGERDTDMEVIIISDEGDIGVRPSSPASGISSPEFLPAPEMSVTDRLGKPATLRTGGNPETSRTCVYSKPLVKPSSTPLMVLTGASTKHVTQFANTSTSRLTRESSTSFSRVTVLRPSSVKQPVPSSGPTPLQSRTLGSYAPQTSGRGPSVIPVTPLTGAPRTPATLGIATPRKPVTSSGGADYKPAASVTDTPVVIVRSGPGAAHLPVKSGAGVPPRPVMSAPGGRPNFVKPGPSDSHMPLQMGAGRHVVQVVRPQPAGAIQSRPILPTDICTITTDGRRTAPPSRIANVRSLAASQSANQPDGGKPSQLARSSRPPAAVTAGNVTVVPGTITMTTGSGQATGNVTRVPKAIKLAGRGPAARAAASRADAGRAVLCGAPGTANGGRPPGHHPTRPPAKPSSQSDRPPGHHPTRPPAKPSSQSDRPPGHHPTRPPAKPSSQSDRPPRQPDIRQQDTEAPEQHDLAYSLFIRGLLSPRGSGVQDRARELLRSRRQLMVIERRYMDIAPGGTAATTTDAAGPADTGPETPPAASLLHQLRKHELSQDVTMPTPANMTQALDMIHQLRVRDLALRKDVLNWTIKDNIAADRANKLAGGQAAALRKLLLKERDRQSAGENKQQKKPVCKFAHRVTLKRLGDLERLEAAVKSIFTDTQIEVMVQRSAGRVAGDETVPWTEEELRRALELRAVSSEAALDHVRRELSIPLPGMTTLLSRCDQVPELAGRLRAVVADCDTAQRCQTCRRKLTTTGRVTGAAAGQAGHGARTEAAPRHKTGRQPAGPAGRKKAAAPPAAARRKRCWGDAGRSWSDEEESPRKKSAGGKTGPRPHWMTGPGKSWMRASKATGKKNPKRKKQNQTSKSKSQVMSESQSSDDE